MPDCRIYLPKSCIEFDGTTSQANGDSSITSIGQEFTISLWLNTLGETGDYGPPLSIDIDDWSSVGGLMFWHQNSNNNMSLRIRNDSDSSETSIVIKANHPYKEWHNYIIIWDKPSLTSYYDGSAGGSTSWNHDIGWDDYSINLGRWSDSIMYNGQIADIRIYNRAISSTEAGDLALGKNITNGLVHHWSCNDGSGDSIEDKIGSVDMTLSNCTWADRYFDCFSKRWDVNNYDITYETFLKQTTLNILRDNIKPGAAGELYKILGRPKYYDKTWTHNNSIRIEPSGSISNLKYMRSEKYLYVKNISDSPVEGESGWLNVKIEGYISGSGGL